MPGHFSAALFSRLQPHSRLVRLGTLIIVVLCAVYSANMVIREDIRTLMPSQPEHLAQNFELLREAPFVQRLTITVGKPGEDPIPLAEALAENLRSAVIPHIITGPHIALDSSILTRLCDFLPGLLDAQDLVKLETELEEAQLAATLTKSAKTLVTPMGLAMREVTAKDPLNLRRFFFSKAADLGGLGGGRVERGHLVDTSGQYALIMAEAALGMTDSDAARAVMQQYRAAVAKLPPGTEVILSGGHRHTEANAEIIKKDMTRILPVSFGILAVLFLVFMRNRQGIFSFLVPVVSLNLACFFMGIWYGSVSGIVLGFGSVLLGITADYGIFVYYSIKAHRTPCAALREVARPLVIGGLTTIAGFAAFFSSSIIGLSHMALFSIFGICVALFYSLVILPHCITSPDEELGTCPEQSAKIVCSLGETKLTIRTAPLVATWVVLVAAIAVLIGTAHIDGDIRRLAYVPEDIQKDEDRTRAIWGGMKEAAMLVVQGPKGVTGEAGLARALEANDRAWEILQQAGVTGKGADASPDGKKNTVISVAPLLPAPATQKARHEQWKQLWAQRGTKTVALIGKHRSEAGFSPGAFAPFSAWIAASPEILHEKGLAAFGLDMLLSLMVKQTKNQTLIFSFMPDSALLSAKVLDALKNEGATFISGSSFRKDISAATRYDFIRFFTLAVVIVTGITALGFRSCTRGALALLPVGVGLLAIVGSFHLLQISVSIFHAVALPLIIGLSSDYGIFMTASLQHNQPESTRKAVLLSALTTIAGFGCLVLANHPALSSLGVSVAAGMTAAMITAVWGIPRFAKAEPC